MPQHHTHSAKNFARVHNKFMVCIQNNQKFHKLYYAFNIYIIGNDNDDDDADDDDYDGGGDDMQSCRYAHFTICK